MSEGGEGQPPPLPVAPYNSNATMELAGSSSPKDKSGGKSPTGKTPMNAGGKTPLSPNKRSGTAAKFMMGFDDDKTAEEKTVVRKREDDWPPFHWTGDYSQERYEALLTEKMHTTVSLKQHNSYCTDYYFDKGGSQRIPYKVPFGGSEEKAKLALGLGGGLSHSHSCSSLGSMGQRTISTYAGSSLGSPLHGSTQGLGSTLQSQLSGMILGSEFNSTFGSSNGFGSGGKPKLTRPVALENPGLSPFTGKSNYKDLPRLLDYTEGSISTKLDNCRLPLIQPDVRKWIKRSQSCLELTKNNGVGSSASIYNGRLVQREMLLPPSTNFMINEGKEVVMRSMNGMNGGRSPKNGSSSGAGSGSDSEGGQQMLFSCEMSASELKATRDLWRESSTCDAYFKGGKKSKKDAGGGEEGAVPGIDKAISEGGT